MMNLVIKIKIKKWWKKEATDDKSVIQLGRLLPEVTCKHTALTREGSTQEKWTSQVSTLPATVRLSLEIAAVIFVLQKLAHSMSCSLGKSCKKTIKCRYQIILSTQTTYYWWHTKRFGRKYRWFCLAYWTPSNQTLRHFLFQSNKPATLFSPSCCLPAPQVAGSWLSKLL